MDELIETIAAALGVDKSKVTANSTSEDFAKWDSLRMVMLGSMMETTYDVTLTADEVSKLSSVSNIVATLKSHGVQL